MDAEIDEQKAAKQAEVEAIKGNKRKKGINLKLTQPKNYEKKLNVWKRFVDNVIQLRVFK